MLRDFGFYFPTRIRFGPGVRRELAPYLKSRGVARALVISDEGLARAGVLAQGLGPLKADGLVLEVFTAVPTNPGVDCVEAALAVAAACRPEAVVSLGGGSPIDVGKAVALLLTNGGPLSRYQWDGEAPKAPACLHVAVPTTAGTGTEVTRTTVIVDRGTKKGIVSDALFPAAAFIDPELMLTMPAGLTAATGADALAHAIEAYVGKGINPITAALAREAVRLLWSALRPACADGSDLEARSRMALGSTLAGIAMDQSGLGIIHSLSGPLSAWYGVHHGLSNAIFLAEAMRFNVPAAAQAMAELAQAMDLPVTGVPAEAAGLMAAEAVGRLCEGLGVGELKGHGPFDAVAIERMAEAAAAMFLARNNPRPVTVADCRELYLKTLR